MNEATLRRWARGQLSTREEQDLYRWMVGNVDPRLPALVQGVLREYADERADAGLRQLGGLWARLTDAFDALFQSGLAEWTSPGAGLLLASAEAPPPMVLVEQDEGAALELTVPEGQELLVFVTDDTPRLLLLWGPGSAPPSRLELPDLEGRSTLWAFVAPSLPRRASAAETLEACLADASFDRQVLRWEA